MSTRSKMKAQGTSVALPKISLFIRLPKRMKQAVVPVAMAMLSATALYSFAKIANLAAISAL